MSDCVKSGLDITRLSGHYGYVSNHHGQGADTMTDITTTHTPTEADLVAAIERAIETSDDWEVIDLADLADDTPAYTEKMVTEKQIDFIARLVRDRDTTAVAGAVAEAREKVMAQTLTAREASDLIDALLAQPYPERKAAPAGMHALGGDIYKVQVSKTSGKPYAKRLTQDTHTGTWSFDYAPGVVYRLSEETLMDDQSAADFGTTYGVCVNCARLLTDPRSVSAGYGPVCAERNGWAWG